MALANSAAIRGPLRPGPADSDGGQTRAYDIQEVHPYVRPGDRCYDAIQNCIRVALALIRSTQGFEALFDLGEDTLESLEPEDRRSCHQPNQMRVWARSFIDQLSNDMQPSKSFVAIVLTDSLEVDAEFRPQDWSRTGKKWAPDEAGYMALNTFAVDSMVQAREARAKTYDIFVFNMGRAIARSLLDCFFHTLAAPQFIPGGHRQKWEYWTFGGPILNLEDLDDELGAHQAGTLWLVGGDKYARQIQRPIDLAKHIPREFVLPLKTAPKKVGAETLHNARSTMGEVRSEVYQKLRPIHIKGPVAPQYSSGHPTTAESTGVASGSNSRPAAAGPPSSAAGHHARRTTTSSVASTPPKGSSVRTPSAATSTRSTVSQPRINPTSLTAPGKTFATKSASVGVPAKPSASTQQQQGR